MQSIAKSVLRLASVFLVLSASGIAYAASANDGFDPNANVTFGLPGEAGLDAGSMVAGFNKSGDSSSLSSPLAFFKGGVCNQPSLLNEEGKDKKIGEMICLAGKEKRYALHRKEGFVACLGSFSSGCG